MREHRSSQRERRGIPHQLQSLIQIAVFVHVNRQNRTENLFDHDLIFRILRLDDRGFDEVSRTVVTLSSADNFEVGRFFCVVNVVFDTFVGLIVDYGRGEALIVGWIADFELISFF